MHIIRIKPHTLNTALFKKPIIAYGAGFIALNLIKKYNLFEHIAFFCDSNSERWKEKAELLNDSDTLVSYDIKSPEELSQLLKNHPDQFDFLVCSMYGGEIIKQLKSMPETSHMNCYHIVSFAYTRLYIYKKITIKNILARDVLYKTIFFKERILNQKLVSESCEKNKLFTKDSQQFETFIRKNKQIIDDGLLTNWQSRASQSYAYGSIKSLHDYGKISYKKLIYFPEMEHGFLGLRAKYARKNSYMFMGKYLYEETRQYSPLAPIFTVGPYIHYAEPIVSMEQIRHEKLKNGKTLLFFLGHSAGHIGAIFDELHLLQELKYIKEQLQIDTMMVCVYWNDFRWDIISKFRENGFQIVTSGLHTDPNFLRRLKTFLLLSDYVVSNDIGTYLPYATYLNKPAWLLSKNVKYLTDSIINNLLEKEGYNELEDFLNTEYIKAYDSHSFEITKEQRLLVEKIFGFSLTKTRQEIKNISQVSHMIWKKSGYIESNYEHATMDIMNQLAVKKDEKSIALYQMLSDALK